MKFLSELSNEEHLLEQGYERDEAVSAIAVYTIQFSTEEVERSSNDPNVPKETDSDRSLLIFQKSNSSASLERVSNGDYIKEV